MVVTYAFCINSPLLVLVQLEYTTPNLPLPVKIGEVCGPWWPLALSGRATGAGAVAEVPEETIKERRELPLSHGPVLVQRWRTVVTPPVLWMEMEIPCVPRSNGDDVSNPMTVTPCPTT